ncbi:hypothetical protein L914_18888 [Plasmopara halstedii]|uniref:Uncharacterized protein n=1 Tax=Plasmopara halstedii TaxID=4781 RepID=A0A0N7L6V7_PLAHL|nr:hypothetical protein L914_18888 [Plasmopara halstedii]CEG45347.1 hypothetical protein L914_18888 [Plasmopara halstedii]|eukprot:XP_024581716.1 hypothetical protein L914_18888 [Plasmopara halstedii]
MSGRIPQFSHPEGFHGRRRSPHTAHQDHPPSSTLLLRGLARSINDEMNNKILDALQSFGPVQARVIYDKATGDSRGFAFVDFDSVESATQAMKTFESTPLILQHRNIHVSYSDGYRRRSDESDRLRGPNWHHDDQRMGERWQPRTDWFCDNCNVTNFARRTVCFQCSTPKPHLEIPGTAIRQPNINWTNSYDQNAESTSFSVPRAPLNDSEMGTRRRFENSRHVVPSQVLVVRMLPPDIEEGELHVAFAEFDGVEDIRLIRDRVTNLSRGFGFVEFRDIQAATNALQQCNNLVVQNTHVEVSYARDTLSTRSQYVAELSAGPRTGSSMVVTALEQAQWSLLQGRGVDVATTDQQNSVVDDVSALLDQAAAAVAPHFQEPKKMWPLPFETAGGSYVYVSEYGLYWDPDSLFYHDAQTTMYHNSFTGTYYRCINSHGSGASAFKEFTPPVPVDDEAFHETIATKETTSTKPVLNLSLKKEKKKAGGLSFAIKTTAFSTASATEGISQVKTVESSTNLVSSNASSVAVGMKRKSLNDIAKWSQRKQNEAGYLNTVPPQPPSNSVEIAHIEQKTAITAKPNAVDSVIDALTNVPQEVPICLLCRRKFGSLEMLRKHEKLSKLHLTNLAKANENKQIVAAQYREHEKEMERGAKKQRLAEAQSMTASNESWTATSTSEKPAAPSLESGFGGKMLKMMGWKSGEGLGKNGTGRTAPIEAIGQGGRSETAGLGLKAPLAATIDLTDVTSEKDRRQRLVRARYDADTA